MSKNEQILNNWGKKIKQYKQLTLSESQELYKEIINCEDVKLKKQLRNELITGTLYIVDRFININKLEYMNSSSYDMEDIISSCIETWIKKIDSGELLNVDEIKKIFNYDFYNKMCENVGITNDIDSKEYLDNIRPFTDLIIDYLKLQELNEKFDYYDLIKYIRENQNYNQLLKILNKNYYELEKYKKGEKEINESKLETLKQNIDEYNIEYLRLFDGIIKSFELNGENINIARTTLYKIRNLAINNGLEYNRTNIDDLIINDLEEQYDEKELKEIFSEILNELAGKNNMRKKVIIKRFGINEEPKTMRQAAKELGVSKDSISYHEEKFIRILKHPSYRSQLKPYLYK